MNSGKLYDEEYYKNNCGPDPYDSQYTINFFNTVAENIIRNFRPETILDVGCAMGHLVSALRERGVKAYGIDISEYAISRVQPEIKPYCRVFSILDGLPSNFPQKYDLLVTIEVAEHLYEEEGEIFIDNICKYSDKIIFSSTSSDIFEKTHYNVQQPEYWAKRFAKSGFFQNSAEKPSYILPQSMFFYKTEDIKQVVEDYERNFRMLNQDLAKLQNDFLVLKKDRAIAQEIMDNQAHDQELLQKDYEVLHKDRIKAQEIMDRQAQRLEQLLTDYELLQKDRAKAQEIMDRQAQRLEQLQIDYELLQKDRANSQEIMINQAQQIIKYQELFEKITNSISWKLTKPLRSYSNKIRGQQRGNIG